MLLLFLLSTAGAMQDGLPALGTFGTAVGVQSGGKTEAGHTTIATPPTPPTTR